MNKVDLEIEYININDKEHFSNHFYSDYIVTRKDLENIFIEEINLVKEKVTRIKGLSNVDVNNITVFLNIKAKNIRSNKWKKTFVSITIIVPLLEAKLSTIIETAIVEPYSTFKLELEKLFYEIERKVLSEPGKPEDITKYNHIVLSGEPLRIILSLIVQFFKEKHIANEKMIFNTNSEITFKVKNLKDGKVEKFYLLRDGITGNLDQDVNIETISSVESDKKIDIIKKHLIVDSIINYATLISFDTGIMSIVMNLTDKVKGLTYKLTYNTDVVNFIESFYTLKGSRDLLIIEIGEK